MVSKSRILTIKVVLDMRYTLRITLTMFSNRLIKISFFILISSLLFTGCSKNPSRDVSIVLETPDGSDPSSSDAVFPRFVSQNEDFQKKLDKLNKEVDNVRSDYDRRTAKGKKFFAKTYVGSSETVPQCTMCWYEEHSLLGDDFNLMTLAYNKNTDEIMTSKDALNTLQIDSITLSTNVARLFRDMALPGFLVETEMQGFETDDSGTVTATLMKLTIEKPDPDNPDEEIEEEHFFYYDVEKETLSSISEHGYDLP